jgi:hypothetical protein
MTKLNIVLIVSFGLKGIAIKTEFQINQASTRSVSEVQFCLSLLNLLRKTPAS